MSHDHNPFRIRWLPLVSLLALFCATAIATASKKDASSESAVTVEEWLLLGPIPAPLPAFSDEGEVKTGSAELLEYEHAALRELAPVSGRRTHSLGGRDFVWTVVRADSGGAALPVCKNVATLAYLAAYVETPRWMELDIEVRSTHPIELFVDGSSVVKQRSPRKTSDPPGKGTVKLRSGKHLMIAKTVCVPGDTNGDWGLDVRLSSGEASGAAPHVSLEPTRRLTIGDVLEAPSVDDLRCSPDGEYVMVSMSKRAPPEGKSDRWIEIRRFKDATLVTTLRDIADGSSWRWAPVGHRVSYVTTKDGVAAIRVLDIDSGESSSIVHDIKNLSDYAWGPAGSFVVYSVRDEPGKDETGVKRLRAVSDRRDHEREKSFLYVSTVPGGMTRRLTAGESTTSLYDIHPDGRSVLIGRTYEDLSSRPYTTTELVRIGLEDQHAEILWKGHWLGSALWSPDGKKILMTAGPTAFGDAGRDVPDGVIPNEYDTQAYIFDPATQAVDPITMGFDPSIVRAFWPRAGGEIYFLAEDTEYVKLYRFPIKSRTFKRVEFDCDVIHGADVATQNPVVILYGSRANRPARVYAVGAGSAKVRGFLDPGVERFADVELGRVEGWNFTTAAGKEIVGRIHFPPDFNAERRWPCIVYYYGGTSPVDRSFGGRYPKDLWAAHGYVVYVLQPSGATGFGQEYSALHGNDWGKIVSEEIIEGTKKFLDAHPFVDRSRVGCIGASFGGFMTQLVITKTNIFSAAVSHAGISSISSYWGEGYWGYEYNAVSAPNSFPWNRPDIYIDQSPLFAADRIETPLLLLHGTADTNVPPGESEQMYTALKLLGKEVEYLRVEDQNHLVLDYKKRITWSDAILGWFDKWLKNEPGWWDDMYPPVAGRGKSAPKELGLRRVELERYGVVLFGEVTREDIEREIEGWGVEYATYAPEPSLCEKLSQVMKDVDVKCVLGTWCSDSIREVPRLWKLLDQLEYPMSRLTMYAVASSRFNEEMGIDVEVLEWSKELKSWYTVEAVSTIIVTRGDEEIGRIIEQPEETLEADLMRMFGE